LNPRSLALLVALAGFMELFDGTVIQTALPAMGRDLGVSATTASVAMAAYFAAAAGAIPICAWLTDRVGARVAFTGAIAVFVLASLWCGSSVDLTWLVFGRIVQGVGGAVMMTVGQIVILRDAPKDRLLNITAYLVWPALAAPVIAPVIGGLITQTFGWRWLFWINLPLGVLAVIASLRLTPGKRDGHEPRPLDLAGAILLAVGLCISIPGLAMVEYGAAPARITAIVVGGLSLVAAVIWLLRHKNPLLDLRAYRFETFRAGNGAGAIYRAVVASVPVLLTLLFQLAYGWSAVNAGLLVMVLFFGNLSIKPFANYSIRRWGYRLVVVAATLLGAAALVILSFVRESTSLWLVVPILYLSGAARSVGFTSYMTMQYLEIPKAEMASANPLSNTVHQVATALGIAGSVGLVSTLGALGLQQLAAYQITFAVIGVVLAVTALWARLGLRQFGKLSQK